MAVPHTFILFIDRALLIHREKAALPDYPLRNGGRVIRCPREQASLLAGNLAHLRSRDFAGSVPYPAEQISTRKQYHKACHSSAYGLFMKVL